MPVTIDGSNTPTAGGVVYGDGTEYASTAAGTSGQLLQSNGASAPSWVAAPTTSPAGSNTQIQYNNSGAFGASSNLTYDGTKVSILSSAATTLESVKSTSTTSQGALVQFLNDTDTPLNFGVWGSSAGSFGTLGASTPFVSTNASTLNLVNTNASGSIVFGTGSSATERFRIASAGQLGIGGANYGTSGQVLTSGGSGAAPTWSTPSSGAVVLISTATASASASIAFTGLTTTYAYYFIEFDSLYNSSAGVNFEMYVSSDNGSTYKGSGQYKTINYYVSFAADGPIRDSTGNQFYIAAQGNGMSGNVAFSASGIVYVYAPAANSCTFTWTTMNQNSTELDTQWGAGTLVTKAAVNAIKFQSSTGNITGNFRLYGVVKV